MLSLEVYATHLPRLLAAEPGVVLSGCAFQLYLGLLGVLAFWKLPLLQLTQCSAGDGKDGTEKGSFADGF